MEGNKLHIVIIPTWMPRPGSTSGIFAREQADAMVEAGHKVSIFMFQYFSLFSWLKMKLKGIPLSQWLPGKHVTPIACNYVHPYPTRLAANPTLAQKKAFLNYAEKKFAAYIKANGTPDIIHHHEIADYCYITMHLSRKFKIPFVLTEHSPFDLEKAHFNPYETRDERMEMLLDCSVRIAVSTFYQKKYEKLFGVPFITIPNLVSNDFTQKPLPPLPKLTKPFKFLHVGVLAKVKGQRVLIQAFAGAFKNNPDVHLTFIGEGPEEKVMKDLVSSAGMEKQIHIPGPIPKSELLKLQDKCNVMVVSSEMETFSVAAAEALTRGNPVLSTRCGGPEDFVNEQNGMLCNVNDVADMQEKLLAIYTRYSSFDCAQIAKQASERFSEQKIVNMLEEVYRSVLAD